ncbi:MAG: hypothetical protein JXB03_01230 [Spirochaetales bacterium]|nr:hypothetical protein [Spirochaetales bacterium]
MSSIIVISDNPDKLPFLSSLKDIHSVAVRNTKGYKPFLEQVSGHFFAYFDYSSFTVRQKTALLKFLKEQDFFEYGILDPLNEVQDPAKLFHDGASDYMGKNLVKSALPKERLSDALSFYHTEEAQEDDDGREYSWSDISPGNEYPFIMLFAEIDILPQWKTKSGKHLIENVVNQFYAHISRVFEPLGGKMWITTDSGGLLLFPRNTSNSGIVRECVRLMLNRALISCEVYNYDALITYRLSLTSGETEYQAAGDTGTLISDSLNFIFHLGQRYTPKGSLIITQDLQGLIPEGLSDLFVPEALFQGKQTYRMLSPSP